MSATYHTVYRDISPASSPKMKRASLRAKPHVIRAPSKEDLPDPMKAVLHSVRPHPPLSPALRLTSCHQFAVKGPIPYVKPPATRNSEDESKPKPIYTRTVMPRLRPQPKGRRHKVVGGRSSTRRHARIFEEEDLDPRFKWRHMLCMG